MLPSLEFAFAPLTIRLPNDWRYAAWPRRSTATEGRRVIQHHVASHAQHQSNSLDCDATGLLPFLTRNAVATAKSPLLVNVVQADVFGIDGRRMVLASVVLLLNESRHIPSSLGMTGFCQISGFSSADCIRFSGDGRSDGDALARCNRELASPGRR
jgi:hypothetical protein